jgi:hypothetical protein
MSIQNTLKLGLAFQNQFEEIEINVSQIDYLERRTKSDTSGNPRYYITFFVIHKNYICDITQQIAKFLNLKYNHKEKAVLMQTYSVRQDFLQAFGSSLKEIQ